jgi:thiosulfate reductase cytochrome b subunit
VSDIALNMSDAWPEDGAEPAAAPTPAPEPVVETPAPPVAAETEHVPAPPAESFYRHTRVVRITHWINLVCVTLLLLSGLQIFNAHPMLYWGAYGADADKPFVSLGAVYGPGHSLIGVTKLGPLKLHTTGLFGVSGGEIRGYPKWLTLPASRDLADGRRWHFFMAWIFVLNGLVYLVSNTINGHFRRDLAPTGEQLRPRNLWRDIVDHALLRHPVGEAAKRYNVLQKLAYLGVIALLVLMVMTGLTMSPGFDAFAPGLLWLFGGRQSARTIHWICANLIVLFVLVHVIEVFIAGVANEIGSMITGRYTIKTGAGR